MKMLSVCIFVILPALLLAQFEVSERESLSQTLLGFSETFSDLKATQDGRIFLSSSSEGIIFPISFDGIQWSKGTPLTLTPPITLDTKISISYPDSNDLLSVCTPFASCTLYSLDGSVKYKKVGEDSFDSLQYGVFERSSSGEALFLLAGETGYVDAFKKGQLSSREYADFLESTVDGLYYPEKSLLVGISNEGEVLLTKTGAQCTTSCFSDGSLVKKVPIDFVNRVEVLRLSLTQETYLATCGWKGIHLFEIDSVSGTASLVSQLSSSGCLALTSIPWEDSIIVIDDTSSVIIYEVFENLSFDFLNLKSRDMRALSAGTASTGTTTTGTTGTTATSGTSGTTGMITTTGNGTTSGSSGEQQDVVISTQQTSPQVVVTGENDIKKMTIGWTNLSGHPMIISLFKLTSGPCEIASFSPAVGAVLQNLESFLATITISESIGVYKCVAELITNSAKRSTIVVDYPITIIVTGSNLKIATRSTLTLKEEVELGVVSFSV